MSLPKYEDWPPPVAFDEMKNQSIDNKKDKEDLQVKFCSIFGPIRNPDGHKEAGGFWEQYGQWKDMLDFLANQECSDFLDQERFCALKSKSSRFYVHNDRLMRRSAPTGQIGVSCPDGQKTVLSCIHEELGHQGVEETYCQLFLRFWWPGLKRGVCEWIQSCKQYQ